MSAPLLPSPLDYIGRRTFAFYPPIRHAAPNAWMLGASCWSEIQVINSQTGRELWIPRQYIGAVSDQHDALVVGLTQNVELCDGQIVPRSHHRVIEMPAPHSVSPHHPKGPASVVGIRLESKTPSVFKRPAFRVGIFILFVAGLFALIESASHMK